MAVTGRTIERSPASVVISTRLVRAIAGGVACAVLLVAPAAVWAGGDFRLAPDVVGTVSMAAVVSPGTVGLGSGFIDTATLTALSGGPQPTGTISFSVYGPTDPGCAGPVLFRSTNTVVSAPSLSGAFSTPSTSFTPPNVGTYHAIAVYSGDANYPSVSSTCGDPNGAVVVGLPPTLTALSPTSGPLGGTGTVTITGTNLTGATSVNFGTVATTPTVIGPTEVVATVPAGSGTVNVTVTTPFGTTPIVPADAYTFVGAAALPDGSLNVRIAPPIAATGTTTKITASSAELTGSVDPSGLATTAHFEYTVRLPGGVTRTATTPARPVAVGFIRGVATADVTGLLAASRYRVRLVATNSAGTTVGPATSFATLRAHPLAAPVLARKFNAEPVSGVVYVRLPGTGRSVQPLTGPRQLPVGTTIDTRSGVVRLSTAAPHTAQSGNFSGATVRLFQGTADHGLPELEFVRASTAAKVCAAVPGHARPRVALGAIYASVTGRFEIRGHDGTVTGSQATWVTTDRCDGLLASVDRGRVTVADFAHGSATAVRGGHSYLAEAA